MADSPWRNEVSVYTDAERLAEEQRVLFRSIRWSWASLGLRAGGFAPTTMPVSVAFLTCVAIAAPR